MAAVREGCVAETLGALIAAERAREADSGFLKSALHRIANDEARHAVLAWRTVKWALERGGDEVREAVMSAFAEELHPLEPARATLRRGGRRSDAARAWAAVEREEYELSKRGAREVVSVCAGVLGFELS